jgi:uncharacterized protein DUF4399
MRRATQVIGWLAVGLIALACAKKEPESSAVSVSITSPTEGDTITASAVHITLGSTGIEIAPAAEARPETAHHHLYLDVDFPQAETAIPMGTAGVVHLGQAQTEYHWENVAPGPHRIIAVLADPGHIPLRPWVTDTVNFFVKAPGDTTVKK